jgi:quinol monooxygenase YgiN
MSVSVIVKFTVKEGQTEDFLAASKQMIEATVKEKGALCSSSGNLMSS